MEAASLRPGDPVALPASRWLDPRALLPTASPSLHPGWEQKECSKEKVSWKKGEKEKGGT